MQWKCYLVSLNCIRADCLRCYTASRWGVNGAGVVQAIEAVEEVGERDVRE